jgi:hypothetical protein
MFLLTVAFLFFFFSFFFLIYFYFYVCGGVFSFTNVSQIAFILLKIEENK